MQNQTDAIYFDLDGTLLDTVADLARAANSVLQAENFATHPETAYKHFLGGGVFDLFRRALPETAASESQLQRCVERMRQTYAQNWNQRTQPYPGIHDLLDELRTRQLPCVVLSNKPHNFTRQIIAHYFPHHPWATVAGAQPHIPLKPDPSSALAIATQHHFRPQHTWYLGDTATDMQTASAAGFHPVGVRWGFRHETELRNGGATHLIQHPLDLLPLL